MKIDPPAVPSALSGENASPELEAPRPSPGTASAGTGASLGFRTLWPQGERAYALNGDTFKIDYDFVERGGQTGLLFSHFAMKALPRHRRKDAKPDEDPLSRQKWTVRETPPKLVIEGGGYAAGTSIPMEPTWVGKVRRGLGMYQLFVPVEQAALMGARLGDPDHTIRYGFDHGIDEHLRAPGAYVLPDGPGKPAPVIDPSTYVWKHPVPEIKPRDAVILEANVRTFTREGTFRAMKAKIPELARQGINILELMPIHGPLGWGYDMVSHGAIDPALGTWTDYQELVDECHKHKIRLVQDFCDNHFGPDQEYESQGYPYTVVGDPKQTTPWGASINYDRPHNEGANTLFEQRWERFRRLARVGMRADAVQNVFDRRPVHHYRRLTDINRAISAETGERPLMIAESDLEDPKVVGMGKGEWGFDMAWADFARHALMVELLGWNHHGYYQDSAGQVVTAMTTGTLAGKKNQGLPPEKMVIWIEDHDHLGANDAHESRTPLMLGLDLIPAAAVINVLLGPPPMFFQGQLRGATEPFPFFRRSASLENAAWVRADKMLVQAQAAGVDFVALGMPDPYASEAAYHALKRSLMEDQRDQGGVQFARVEEALRATGRYFIDPEGPSGYGVAVPEERPDGLGDAFEEMYTKLLAFRKQHAGALAAKFPEVTKNGSILTIARDEFTFSVNWSKEAYEGWKPGEIRFEAGFPEGFALPDLAALSAAASAAPVSG